jgi:cell division protein FtsL
MEERAFVRELRNSFSFGTVRTLVLLIALFALVGLIYLGQSSQATLTGARMLELQGESERLKRENAQLEYEIAVLTTPAKIAERARAQGLRPATISQTIYVTVKDYPVTPPQPAPVVTESPTTPPTSDSFVVVLWNEVLTRLGLAPSGRAVEATASP